MKIRIVSLMLVLSLLEACSTSGSPVKQFTKGDELAFYDFTSPATFEEGTYGNNTARLEVSNGVYNIQLSAGDNVLYYGQWGATLGDVIIDVDATQTSADLNSAYGVMCRARGTVGQTVKAEATAEATEVAGSDTIIASGDTQATTETTSDASTSARVTFRMTDITPEITTTGSTSRVRSLG